MEGVHDGARHSSDAHGQHRRGGGHGGSGGGGEDDAGRHRNNAGIGGAEDVQWGEDFFEILNKRDGHPDFFRPSRTTLESPLFPACDTNNLGRFGKNGMGLGDLAHVFYFDVSRDGRRSFCEGGEIELPPRPPHTFSCFVLGAVLGLMFMALYLQEYGYVLGLRCS